MSNDDATTPATPSPFAGQFRLDDPADEVSRRAQAARAQLDGFSWVPEHRCTFEGLCRLAPTTARSLPNPPSNQPSAADLDAALVLLGGQQAELRQIEIGLIEARLDAGGTWEIIAVDLDAASPDAARQRYRRLGGTRTWPAGRPAKPDTGVRITDEAMTAAATPHHATRDELGSWRVTWLPDVALDRNAALTAMTLAEHVAVHGPLAKPALIGAFATELDLSSEQAVTAIQRTSP